MLKALRQVQCTLQDQSRLLAARAFATAWPAEVPEGAKPFDPKGSLSQIDMLLEGLPESDPWVVAIKKFKELRVAREKLEVERHAAGPSLPNGLVTTAHGDVDQDYYVTTQGMHPDFVKELNSLMQEEKSKLPTPKPDTSWQDAWNELQPMVEEEQQNVLKELDEIQAKERELEEIEERLDDITVDEVLAKYPDLAQEIKDEIEAGDYSMREAGYRATAVTPVDTASPA